MKRTITLLMAVLMIMSLAACSSSAPAATEAPAPAETAAVEKPAAEAVPEHEDVTLSTWYFATNGVDPHYQAWADKVHEEYPWITIEFEVLPYDSGPEKFTVACATGTTPDIYFDGFSRIAPAVYAGLTIDLTDVVVANQDRFYGDQVDGIIDGRNHYVSYADGAPYGLVLNMTLAKELGIDGMLPEDMETWSYEEFLAFCRAAKEARPDVIPLSLYAGSKSGDAWYYSWFLGNGADITNEDLSATAFNTGDNQKAALEVLDLFKTLIDEGLVPAGCASLVDNDTKDFFYTGDMLFMPTAANMIPNFYTLMQDGQCIECDMEFVALPTASGKEAPTTVSWGSYGICGFNNNGNEEAIKLAMDVFLKYPEFRVGILTAHGILSKMNDCTVEYATESITNSMNRAADYGARCADSSFGIREAWWSDFRETFYVQLQDFMVGNIDAETMLTNWQTSGDAVISAALAK